MSSSALHATAVGLHQSTSEISLTIPLSLLEILAEAANPMAVIGERLINDFPNEPDGSWGPGDDAWALAIARRKVELHQLMGRAEIRARRNTGGCSALAFLEALTQENEQGAPK